MNDGIDSQHQIGAVINHGGYVARADAQGGFAAGIGGFHHAGSAGGQDNIRFPHECVGHLQGGHVDPANDPFRRAGFYRRVQDHLCRRNSGLFRPGMGTEDDAVAGFQTNQRLENGGGSGVCGGNNRRHHADRLGNLFHAIGFVFLNHAAGFRVPVSIVDVFTGVVIFNHLVFHNAHAGFLHGHPGQRNPGLIGGRGGGQKDPVHLLLGEVRVDPLCGAHPADGRVQRFHTVHHVKSLGFHTAPPLPVYVIHRLPHGDKPAIKPCFHDAPSHPQEHGCAPAQS